MTTQLEVQSLGVPDPMMLRPFTVKSKLAETSDTVTLGFAAADEGPATRFEPGQFMMVYVFGVGEVPLSISGDPSEPEVLVHTVRDVGAVTGAICSLRIGDSVGIRGPYGTSWPVEPTPGRDVVLVAGGIGLAPLRPALYHLLANRSRYDSVSVVYGSRTSADLLYREELAGWRSRPDVDFNITVDRDSPDWVGDVGMVTPLLDRLRFIPSNTTAIVCGPEIMMRVVAKDLIERDVHPDDIYVSLERNFKCGIGFCGHCQIGPKFACKDGPVAVYSSVADLLGQEEL
ncbi:MAG: FAD/NAD(P)-binding protein [Actinomycetota bacterium]|nr:FAD/NAD(P)-binding protein [Actinomycetota bacterium]